ncbi:MAG: thiol reductase thioredoxin [Caldilinea sp. CFX5]|nr:thiol reductase thioredoxin [Caldilinea sp. CFX5]
MIKQLLQRIGFASTQPSTRKETSVAKAPALTIIEVTDADFVTVVLGSNKLAVVDFWAEWCQPCQIMSAYVGFLAQEYGDRLLIAAMDVDENPQIPERYTIMGLPTLLLMQNGVEVDRIVGVEEYQTIKARVESLLNAGPT